MKLSARNKIKQIKPGAVNSEVVLDLGNRNEVASIITKESADRLEPAPGKQAYAVIKASNVMIAID